MVPQTRHSIHQARRMAIVWLLFAGVLAVCGPGLAHAQPTTTRVSVGPGGVQANSGSFQPAISADGRWVAFQSGASNLVAAEPNDMRCLPPWCPPPPPPRPPDIFVRDQQLGTTTRVSVGPGGTQANGASDGAVISADGRWVAFASYASNLVMGDTNSQWDVFVLDRQTGTTARVSLGSGGAEGNRGSQRPAISADGRWVAFESEASNLVAGDTNDAADVFVHDRQTGTTTRVSEGPGGAQGYRVSYGAAISADGRWVAFNSDTDNLVTGDTNSATDVFVHDRHTGTTTRVSLASGGTQANGASWSRAISANGQWVAFVSDADNLVAGDTNDARDVFVHDRQTGTTARVSLGPGGAEGNGPSEDSTISVDGRWVSFQSRASNLVVGDANGRADVFVHDRQTGTTERVSVGAGGVEGDADSAGPAISADGRWVAFQALAGNLVAGDTNNAWDVFAHDRVSPLPPEGLVAAVVGNIVTLRWTIPSGGPVPTNFVLEGGFNPGEVLASVPTGSAAPILVAAAPAGSFYLRVRALNGAFPSAASNEILVHVNVPVAPSAPANLLGLVDSTTLTLAWTNTYLSGAPTNVALIVSGALNGAAPLGLTDSFTFAGVPPGTYTLAIVATNASGASVPSNSVTLTFPAACSGPPQTVTNFAAYNEGRTLFVRWGHPVSGAAPTSYVLRATGTYVASMATPLKALSGAVPPGTYSLSVMAANPCGQSPGSAPLTVVVP